MGVPFLDLKAEYEGMKPEIDRVIHEVLESGRFVLGEKVAGFETDFARFNGVSHAVGVNSGTSAVYLALRALGIGPGDEVITQANTFVATCEAIAMTGALPRLVDVLPSNYNMDPSKIRGALTDRTKAILPVHLYGLPADMEPILGVARDAEVPVVEDAAQAHGALCDVTGATARTGSMGDLGAFSFYPSKNLGCYGEGGAVVTDSERLYENLVALRDHGQKGKHAHTEIGGNYRMSAFQGAILGVKLKRLEQSNQKRIELAELYADMLSPAGVVLPKSDDGKKHVFHLYVIQAERREDLRQHLQEKGIGTGIHYPYPVHLCPAFEYLGYEKGDFPVSEELSRRVLSLPMYPQLAADDVRAVCQEIRAFLE